MKEIIEYAKNNPEKVKKFKTETFADGYKTTEHTEVEFFDKPAETRCICGREYKDCPTCSLKGLPVKRTCDTLEDGTCACGKTKCNCWEPKSFKFPNLRGVFLKGTLISTPIKNGYITERTSGRIEVHITDADKNTTVIFLDKDGTFNLG